MGDNQKNAPLAGERAKGALPSSAENRASKTSQTHAPKATRQPRFIHNDQVPILTSGKVARSLHALVVAGAKGITARGCGAWACRLAAYVYVLRRKHGLEIGTCRIQTGRSWHGRYVLVSAVAIVKGRR
ncbi:MAG: winged helix domain-containing protein [Methylocella sp.]